MSNIRIGCGLFTYDSPPALHDKVDFNSFFTSGGLITIFDYNFNTVTKTEIAFTALTLPRYCRCGLALLAQFYPKKYPENYWVLLVCVGLYIAATLFLNSIFSGMEGDVFYIAKAKVRSLLATLTLNVTILLHGGRRHA